VVDVHSLPIFSSLSFIVIHSLFFFQEFKVKECFHSLLIFIFCLKCILSKSWTWKSPYHFRAEDVAFRRVQDPQRVQVFSGGWLVLKVMRLHTIAVNINYPKRTRHITYTWCIWRIQIRRGISMQKMIVTVILSKWDIVTDNVVYPHIWPFQGNL
jgi:hypothetical protein